MYFSTCEHYLYNTDALENMNEPNHMIEYNICFVCLEVKDQFENEYCITLHNNLYIKVCRCNGWIHKSCLNIWYNQKKQCPVCLCKMIQETKTINFTCISIYSKIRKICELVSFNIVYIKLVFYFLFLVWFYYNFIFFLVFLIKNIRVRPTYYS